MSTDATAAAATAGSPRSLVWATELDVLPPDHVTVRRDRYLTVRSPGNPTHYWGNLLLYDEPPGPGDGPAWERAFEAEFADRPGVRHHTFAWDRVDGQLGFALEEFVARGYELEQSVGLVAAPRQLCEHRRANREVVIQALDPGEAEAETEASGGPRGADADLWRQVLELQVASRDPEQFDEASYRAFVAKRLRDLRALFRAGRGSWYVALLEKTVAASCGVVVTGGRGRFQTVDTAAPLRRRGICSRLVVNAAHRSADRFGADRFVIVADPEYHALGLYESLGFRRREYVAGVFKQPS